MLRDMAGDYTRLSHVFQLRDVIHQQLVDRIQAQDIQGLPFLAPRVLLHLLRVAGPAVVRRHDHVDVIPEVLEVIRMGRSVLAVAFVAADGYLAQCGGYVLARDPPFQRCFLQRPIRSVTGVAAFLPVLHDPRCHRLVAVNALLRLITHRCLGMDQHRPQSQAQDHP
jgi:hypothetical protein